MIPAVMVLVLRVERVFILYLGGSITSTVGSSGSQNNGFQLLKDYSITIKNDIIQMNETVTYPAPAR